MKNKEEKQAKAVSAAIAQVRGTLSRSFSLKELGKILHGEKCPYAHRIPGIMKNKVLITQRLDGKYEFTSQNPIHYKYFESGLEVIRKQKADAQKRWADGAKSKVTQPEIILVNVKKSDNVEDMINFLKERGYKVFKPVTIFEEI